MKIDIYTLMLQYFQNHPDEFYSFWTPRDGKQRVVKIWHQCLNRKMITELFEWFDEQYPNIDKDVYYTTANDTFIIGYAGNRMHIKPYDRKVFILTPNEYERSNRVEQFYIELDKWLTTTFNDFYSVQVDKGDITVQHLPTTPNTKFYELLKRLMPFIMQNVLTSEVSEAGNTFTIIMNGEQVAQIQAMDNFIYHTELIEEEN